MLSISCGWELGQEAGQGRCVRHAQGGDRGRLVLDSQQCPVRVETTPGKRDCSMAHTLGLEQQYLENKIFKSGSVAAACRPQSRHFASNPAVLHHLSSPGPENALINDLFL